ncbi:hypothetical protein ACIG5D_32540 [Microbispora rosea]|uniref:hypothetical protein n=1 Tax=Microbispora rosea TaxID=58117 RepID=UPI0037B21D75
MGTAARDLATLSGQHDVPVRSLSYGERHAGEQISLRRQDILEPAAIRALEPGTALLLAIGVRPALLKLRPWYSGPHAGDIAAARDRAVARITAGAVQHAETGAAARSRRRGNGRRRAGYACARTRAARFHIGQSVDLRYRSA